MATKASAPWEGEKAPDDAATAPDATPTPDPSENLNPEEAAKAAAEAAAAEDAAKDPELDAVDTSGDHEPSGQVVADGDTREVRDTEVKVLKKGKERIVVGGTQVDLRLANLLSQGYKMKDAKKKLGIE